MEVGFEITLGSPTRNMMDNRARDTRWRGTCFVQDGNMESSKQGGVIHVWLGMGTLESNNSFHIHRHVSSQAVGAEMT